MELKEIKQIVELMNKHELSYFHLEKDNICLELKKGVDLEAMQELLAKAPVAAAPQISAPPAALPTAPANAPAAAGDAPSAEEGDVIKAPMVGTFYRAADPDSEPFVKVGSEVEPDTTICMIEAMKTFNEIKAECRGTIVKILVDNAQPVGFEDPLFVIKPA